MSLIWAASEVYGVLLLIDGYHDLFELLLGLEVGRAKPSGKLAIARHAVQDAVRLEAVHVGWLGARLSTQIASIPCANLSIQMLLTSSSFLAYLFWMASMSGLTSNLRRSLPSASSRSWSLTNLLHS